MEITILAFGQIAELTGRSSWIAKDVNDTETLQRLLAEELPAINNISYAISVDKKIVKENTALTHQCTVALLPPFSGG